MRACLSGRASLVGLRANPTAQTTPPNPHPASRQATPPAPPNSPFPFLLASSPPQRASTAADASTAVVGAASIAPLAVDRDVLPVWPLHRAARIPRSTATTPVAEAPRSAAAMPTADASTAPSARRDHGRLHHAALLDGNIRLTRALPAFLARLQRPPLRRMPAADASIVASARRERGRLHHARILDGDIRSPRQPPSRRLNRYHAGSLLPKP